jgi:RHS repeat-associated protein
MAYSALTGYPDTLTYPTTPAGPALRIQYGYSSSGVTQSITDLTDSLPSPLWTANSQNAAGQITEETFGNGVMVNHAFDAVTGWPTGITAGPGGGGTLQNESFLFDAVGNLIQRSDNYRGFVENIYPDADDRIDHTTINGNADMQMSYNANGSIHSRQFSAPAGSSDDYQSPNSLVAESSNALAGGDITFTSFNQPSVITGPTNSSSTILYDHNHQRWQQRATYGGTSETTTYIGGLLEKVVTASGTVYRHYIPVGSSTVMYVPSGASPAIDYFTGDHLASTATITDQNGNLLLAESFSPWGARRDPTNWTLHQSPADAATLATVMRHGFTGHEHLDNLAMIDMNGRMYQGIGFMSPDPILQNPINTQDYNRYSYARNNPLTYVDPSGFDLTPDMCGQAVCVYGTCRTDNPTYCYSVDPNFDFSGLPGTPSPSGNNTGNTTPSGGGGGPANQCTPPPMNTSADRPYSGPGTHNYSVSSSVSGVSATQAQQIEDLWRNGPNAAPGIAPNTPDLTPTLLANIPFTPNANWIYIQPINNGWKNVTLPGHYFSDGTVTNTVTYSNGSVTLTSVGTGNTLRWFQNDALGLAFFKQSQVEALNAALLGTPRIRVGGLLASAGSCNNPTH